MAKITLESVFIKTSRVIKGGSFGLLNGRKYPKDIIECGCLGDLKKIASKFNILNLLGGNIIRKIQITDKLVIIDACDGSEPISLPITDKVYYEPWTLDRGSYLINIPNHGLGKLATELDIVQIEGEK